MPNPQLTAIEPQSAHMIKVTFNTPVGDSALNPDNYQLSGTGQGSLPDYPDFIERIDDTNLYLIWISAGINKSVEYGSSVQLDAIVGGSGPYQYLWSPADGLDDPTSRNPIATPTQTTEYTLTVAREGESLSDSGAITDSVEVKVLYSSITQYGITWTFDRPYECGQFINGDWWVVGPTIVSSVNPMPQQYNYGGTVGIKWINGSHVNPVTGSKANLAPFYGGQWWDERAPEYVASMSYPATINTGDSLVSTISHLTYPPPKNILNGGHVDLRLKTAAVLTCVSSVQSSLAFRPGWAGTNKTIYNYGDLQLDLLPSLPYPGGTVSYPNNTYPSVCSWYSRIYQRIWLGTHICDANGRYSNPSDNMPDYYREIYRIESEAALLVLCDIPNRNDLIIGLIQKGIDNYNVVLSANENGTRGGSRELSKWPIIFAGLLLNDSGMMNVQYNIFPYFREESQTYTGVGWTGATALWRQKPGNEHEHLVPELWYTVARDGRCGCKMESYRRGEGACFWIGQALSMNLLNAVDIWNYAPFFDYVDRWMNEDDENYYPRAISVCQAPQPWPTCDSWGAPPGAEGVGGSTFVNNMWAIYS